MLRRNGFIDLDRMLSKKEIIKVSDIHDVDNLERIDIFTYDGKQLYFFKTPMFCEPYSELIAEEILEDFDLPHATYDLAIHKKRKGVLTKDFRKKDKKYVNGLSILEEYFKHNKSDDSDYLSMKYNNLDDIWNALEYRYKDKPNKKEIVSKLMNQLVDLLIFDILVANSDRTYNNYQIEEGEDDINLAPIFDNEGVLYNCNNISFYVEDSNNNLRNSNPYVELEKFLDYGDSAYINRIKDKLWIISDDNIEKVYEKISRKTGFEIPDGLAVDYMKEFMNHREKIEKIIEKYDKGQVIR